MQGKAALYSRLQFFFVLVCTAFMSFIMCCSDAARASPITTQVENGVRHNVLRRLYTPYSQHRTLPSTQTGTHSATEISGNYGETSSIIDRQSNPLRFTGESFSYYQNIPDNRVGITGVQSEMMPASTIFTSHSQNGVQSFEREPSRINYPPHSREVAQSGNSYYSYPVIIRKSSHKEAASPFHQSSSPSQVWAPKDAQELYTGGKAPGNDSPKLLEDEPVWQSSDSSLLSSQTGRYWSTSPPTSRGHYSSYRKTNELAVVGPWSTSSGIESSQILSFASQTVPHAPSISNSLDASVVKSPSPEKLTSSITDFSQRWQSVRRETPKKEVQSYLFKDSQTSFGGHETVNTVTGDRQSSFTASPRKEQPSDAKIYSSFSSNFEHLRQLQRKKQAKEVQDLSYYANPLYYYANMAQYGAQTDSFTKNQRTTAETLAQMSVNPPPGTDNTKESVVHVSHADFQGNSATGSEKSVVSSLGNSTTRGSTHAYKPGRTTKSIYGFRGFENPTWRAVNKPSIHSSSGSNEQTNSRRYSFDKGNFKIAKLYPSLSPKYSFSQREASHKPERAPTDHSSPSPGTLDIIQTLTTTRPFPSARPLLPERDAGMGSNPEHRQFRIYRKIYGLKGFGTRPLEGAKPSISEADKPARFQQGFEGFRQRSSQIWQPKTSRIHRWYNKTKPGSSNVSTVSQNEQSSEDLKSLLKTAGSPEVFTLDKYKKNRKIYTHLGFHPIQQRIGNASNKTDWKYKEQNPSVTSAGHIISSTYLRSTGDLKVESRPKFDPRTPDKTNAMKANLLNSSTSSMVRGKRVKGKHSNGQNLNGSTSLTNEAGKVAIVRLPKRPARVKAVTYSDILGSASFSGVRATTQTPIKPADKDYFPTASAATTAKERASAVHSRDNTSRGPEEHAEDEQEDFSSVEKNKLGVGGKEVDSDMKTLDLFLDNEGSGSGAFNMSDVLSTDTTKSRGLSEDLLELDYLRVSTENISFNSMKLSHTEK